MSFFTAPCPLGYPAAESDQERRPGLTELLKYARDGDQVFVDRLGRSLIDALKTLNEMTSRGIALYSRVGGVDPFTASPRHISILGAKAPPRPREKTAKIRGMGPGQWVQPQCQGTN